MRKINSILLIIIISAIVLIAQEHDPAKMATQYAESAKQNAMLLRQYSWKMRIEVIQQGETKSTTVYQMRFDLDGNLQQTAITEPTQQKKKRGIRGKMAAKKAAEMQEWSGKVTELAKKYMAPSPGTMMDFFLKASFTTEKDGSVKISGKGFLQPDDQATFWGDPNMKNMSRFQFITNMEGDEISGKVDYKQVQGGPQYAARTVIDVPTKEFSIKIENYDYIKQ